MKNRYTDRFLFSVQEMLMCSLPVQVESLQLLILQESALKEMRRRTFSFYTIFVIFQPRPLGLMIDLKIAKVGND